MCTSKYTSYISNFRQARQYTLNVAPNSSCTYRLVLILSHAHTVVSHGSGYMGGDNPSATGLTRYIYNGPLLIRAGATSVFSNSCTAMRNAVDDTPNTQLSTTWQELWTESVHLGNSTAR